MARRRKELGVEDWGLPPEVAQELLAELADHAACAVAEARPSFAPPQAMHWLAAAHPVEQLQATVLRLPRGPALGALLLFIAGLSWALIGDGLASRAMVWPAWLLQGAGWGSAAAGIALLLQGAWRRGSGLALARLLQLTPLVTLGLLVALVTEGSVLSAAKLAPVAMALSLPVWSDVRLLPTTGILLAISCLTLNRRWSIALAAGLAAATAVLYPGAPLPATEYRWTQPAAAEAAVVDARQTGSVPGLLTVSRTAGSLEVQAIVPQRAWLHRGVPRGVELGEALLAQRQFAPQAPGQLEAGRHLLLQPLPDPHCGLQLLLVLVPLLGLSGAAALSRQLVGLAGRPAQLVLPVLSGALWTGLCLAPLTNLHWHLGQAAFSAAYGHAARLLLASPAGLGVVACVLQLAAGLPLLTCLLGLPRRPSALPLQLARRLPG